ncbi:flippase-like domain-containing protein [Dyadobacter sp. CY345]|uniref:lysylphosphatidylglycerol synthase transmembrane domain-containing protein n=1 Tax=Dyadobacter sp. CY345 TaxID=2909335 RepID=UPI001F4764A2|nr:lysylphosphatidylglycerol synthase transmembrane domain-containing protein [Dyadobacter sp. CY345]MCF2443986.1 flippase-like domain-containing protein [Dyadobacter sp. CY345]
MKIFKVIMLVVVLLCLAFFVQATDWQLAARSLHNFGYRFLYLILISGFAYLLATIGWKFCLGEDGKKVKLTDLFIIRHLGEMLSIINPASVIGGEAFKVYLLQQKGLENAKIIASVLVSRVLMAVTQLLLFFVTLFIVGIPGNKFFINPSTLQRPDWKVMLLLISFSMILLYFIFSKRPKQKLRQNKTLAFLDKKLNIRHIISEFKLFFQKDKKAVFFSALFFTLHWIAGSMEIYFILKVLGVNTSITSVLFVDMGIIIFKSAGAFVPGQIGVEEFGNKVMLDLIGVSDMDIWFTLSVLRRCRQLFWILFGLAIYLLYYKKIKAIPGTT